MRIAAGSYTNSKARSMKEWAEKNKYKIKENKRRWRERKKQEKAMLKAMGFNPKLTEFHKTKTPWIKL